MTRLVRDKALSELLAQAVRQGWRIERERKHSNVCHLTVTPWSWWATPRTVTARWKTPAPSYDELASTSDPPILELAVPSCLRPERAAPRALLKSRGVEIGRAHV